MEPGLRAQFNADFTPEKYAALLRCVNGATKWPADFRISETPIFLTREFTDEAVYAANEIAAQTQTPEFARHAASAIPPGLEVPNESNHPEFLIVDLAVCDDGHRLVPRRIERIYNRVIFDELARRPEIEVPFRFQDELDVTWIAHPNWYYRISKHSLPFIKTAHTSPAFFADELPASEEIDDYVLKPLYSFAGLGVDMQPTREKIAALKNPHQWILQKKVEYASFVPTVDGPKSKAELRMMFIWSEKGEPVLLNNLVRMSQGKMMGVDFNKDKTWVGSSIALHDQ